MIRLVTVVSLFALGCIDPPKGFEPSNNATNNATNNASNNATNNQTTNNTNNANNATNNGTNGSNMIARFQWSHNVTSATSVPVYLDLPSDAVGPIEGDVRVVVNKSEIPSRTIITGEGKAVWALVDVSSEEPDIEFVVLAVPATSTNVWSDYESVHHFSMTNNDGNFDSETTSNPVSVGVASPTTEGRFGNGIRVTSGAINQYTLPAISVGSNTVLTIAVWYREDAEAPGKHLLLQQRAPCRGYEVFVESQVGLNATFGNANPDGTGCGTAGLRFEALPRGTDWHQMIVSIDRVAGMFYLFLDGELRTSRTIATTGDASGGPLVLGSGNTDDELAEALGGAMDELRIWTQPVTEDWVRAQFHAAQSIERQ